LTVISTTRVYAGKLLNVDRDLIINPAEEKLDLEIVRHPGAAAVVPVVSDLESPDPSLLLIHQYRYAAGGTIWEIPAGILKPGEDPEMCAHRELKEETGAEAVTMTRLTTILTTPGFTDERIHLFVASDLTVGDTNHETDEVIEVRSVPLSRVLEMARDGDISDAKSLVGILYFAGFILNR
jgi:ADP-ribose pyrophosphatase